MFAASQMKRPGLIPLRVLFDHPDVVSVKASPRPVAPYFLSCVAWLLNIPPRFGHQLGHQSQATMALGTKSSGILQS
jgi:hypothetical protein